MSFSPWDLDLWDLAKENIMGKFRVRYLKKTHWPLVNIEYYRLGGRSKTWPGGKP